MLNKPQAYIDAVLNADLEIEEVHHGADSHAASEDDAEEPVATVASEETSG